MRKILILCLIVFITANIYAQNFTRIRECVIVNGVLQEIDAEYDPARGDKWVLVSGSRKKFTDVYPQNGAHYAAAHGWYVNNEQISFEGRPYVKYGLPRILGVNEIEKTDVYKGVGVYKERGIAGVIEVIYIPVRQGCEFQPYQLNCTGKATITKISGTESAVQFSAKATGLSGTLNYSWTCDGAVISKGQGTSSVTIDTRNNFNEDRIELSVTITDAKKCPVIEYESFEVKKTKNPTTPNWTAADKKSFMDNCMGSTGMPADESKAYCSCMMEKIIKIHPNVRTVEQELTKENIEKMAKDCLK